MLSYCTGERTEREAREEEGRAKEGKGTGVRATRGTNKDEEAEALRVSA